MATGIGGTVFWGPEGLSQFGRQVRAIGDLNNDGIADFAVSTSRAGNGYGNPDDNADMVGITYVVYGQDGDFDASYDLAFGTGVQPDGTFYSVFQGDQPNGWLGEMLNSAGDINGDGIDDLVVGSDRYNDSDGAAFVIYGQDGGLPAILEPGDIDGSNGAHIGAASTTQFAIVADGPGDVNGDGHDDLLLSSQNDQLVYLLFGDGNALPASIDLTSDLSDRVHVFSGADTRGEGIGDINGDGLGDFLLQVSGGGVVVFGDAALGSGTTDLSTATFDGSDGFTATLGGIWRVSDAGDVNDDGIGDFLYFGHSNSYLIFGSDTGFPATLAPEDIDGSNGFSMGASPVFNVGGTGDMNGDGIDDFVVGDRNANGGRGVAYVVFGQSDGFDANLDLSTLDGTNGYRISGAVDMDNLSGGTLADVNNDGFADLITVAPRFDVPTGGSLPIWDVGATYIVYGGGGRLAAFDAEDGTQDGSIDLALAGATLDFEEIPIVDDGILGTEDNDTLTGTDGDDTIKGLGGDDRILGGDGNDSMEGGAGRDIFEGTTGFDTVNGGEGRDLLINDVTGTAADAFSLLVDLTNGTLHAVEFPTTGNDVLISIEDYRIIGDISATLLGDDQDNMLEADNGNDLLEGNGGNDSLSGGNGNDTLIGGDGDDTMVGGQSEDDIRDVMYGGAGNDTMDGGYGNDELRGDAGDDRMAGGFGADTVIGGTGNDTLTGSAFSDQIFGGDGDDFVNGGWGHDRVNGGAGADQFFHIGIFNHGSDWIQDYNAAEGDVLMFGNTDATRGQFQINPAHRTSADGERAGDDEVAEAFVIYRPTGQIMWALVDGMGQDSINLQIGEQVFDLMA